MLFKQLFKIVIILHSDQMCFKQINAALVSIRDFFQKVQIKKSYQTLTFHIFALKKKGNTIV